MFSIFFLIHKIAQSITNIHTGSIHNLGIWSIFIEVSAAACLSVSVEKQVIKAWVFCFLAPVQALVNYISNCWSWCVALLLQWDLLIR